MCMCGKPTINGEPGYSWDGKRFGVRPPAPPEIEEGETILYDEPGRCGGVDSHCHHFRVVRPRFGKGLDLLVRHGGGTERIEHLTNHKALERVLAGLDSNGRYWTLCALWHAASSAASRARESEAKRWREAAVEKRLRTRKRRGCNVVDVWIEPKTSPPAITAAVPPTVGGEPS